MCGQYASYWNAFLLHLSVILFTGGKGSLSRGVSVQVVLVQGGLCPGKVSVKGVSVSGVSVQKDLCWGVSVQEGLCPGGLGPEGSLSRGGLC